MAKSDLDWLDKKIKQFANGDLKVAENDEEASEIHWAQDPEEVYLKLQMEEDKKLHDVDVPKVS